MYLDKIPDNRLAEYFAGIFEQQVFGIITNLSDENIIFGQKKSERKSQRKKLLIPQRWGIASHETLELSIVLEGNPIIGIGNMQYLLKPGDTCIYRPFVRHYESPKTKNCSYQKLWFHFWDDILGVNLAQYTSKSGFKIPLVIHIKELATDGKELSNELIRELKQSKRLTAIKSILLELISKVAKISIEPQTGKKMKNSKEKIAGEIKRLIKEKYNDTNLTLKGIANKVSLSPNYISSLFKDETGVSIVKFFNNLRIKDAKKLLLNTDYPVKSISYQVGYKSQRYFSEAFNKLVGLPPQTYRNLKKT